LLENRVVERHSTRLIRIYQGAPSEPQNFKVRLRFAAKFSHRAGDPATSSSDRPVPQEARYRCISIMADAGIMFALRWAMIHSETADSPSATSADSPDGE
jgi:hypothetical protein